MLGLMDWRRKECTEAGSTSQGMALVLRVTTTEMPKIPNYYTNTKGRWVTWYNYPGGKLPLRISTKSYTRILVLSSLPDRLYGLSHARPTGKKTDRSLADM